MDGWHLALLLAGVAVLCAAVVANRFVARSTSAPYGAANTDSPEAVAAQP